MIATILDVSDIALLVKDYEGEEAILFVRNCIVSKDIFVFFSRELNTALFYTPESRGRYQMHIYSKGRGGRELRNWCIQTGSYVFDNSSAEYLINWVEKSNRGLQFFMSLLGSSKVGSLEYDILYCIKREDRVNIEERIK